MTDDLRARLEADQRVIEEATEGPWEKGDGWVYTKPVYDDDTRLSNVLGMRYADRDRERQEADRAQRNVNFIAASRTRWEQANAALLAVLDLHRESSDGDCIHACGDQVQYPCATVRAIEEAMQ